MPLTSQVGRDQIISSVERPFLAGRDRQADLAEELLLVEVERAPLLGDFLGQFLDPVVEAGQGDRAVGVVQVGEDARQHADRIDRRAAVDAGMQVAVGRVDRHLLERQAAQHGGDRRRFGVPHPGVADQRQVGLQRFGVGGEERRQRHRAGLLLALEQHGDVAGQAAVGAEGPAGLEEGHQLALVVAGAAGDDALARAARRPAAARTAGFSTGPADPAAGRRNGRRTARSARRESWPWPSRRPSAGRRCRGARPRSRDRRVRASASRRRARNRRNGREPPRPRESSAARTGGRAPRPGWRRSSASTSSSVAMRSPAAVLAAERRRRFRPCFYQAGGAPPTGAPPQGRIRKCAGR